MMNMNFLFVVNEYLFPKLFFVKFPMRFYFARNVFFHCETVCGGGNSFFFISKLFDIYIMYWIFKFFSLCMVGGVHNIL